MRHKQLLPKAQIAAFRSSGQKCGSTLERKSCGLRFKVYLPIEYMDGGEGGGLAVENKAA